MSCEERQDQIVSYALGTLAPGEAEQVRAHLESGCASCASFLKGIELTVDQLLTSVPPVSPSPLVKERLLKRVAMQARSDVPPEVLRPTPAGPGRRRWTEALAAGAVAAAITVAVLWPFIRHDRQTIASLRQELAHQQVQIDQLRGAVRHDSTMIELLQSPAVQLIALQGTEVQPQAKARVFRDQTNRSWHFFAADLRAPAAGNAYELWLINGEKKKFPAGTFAVNTRGEGSLVARAPADAGTIVAVAVTEEPATGSSQPTGPIALLGEVR